MKRKIFGVAFLVALVVTAGWNFNRNMNETKLNDLALANVEALARDEGSTVKCCKDPLDQCTLSSGDIISDYDEAPKGEPCPI